MARVLVAGLINVETTLRIEGFPIDYRPQTFTFHGIRTTASGVGYNVSKALTALGHEVRFLSLIAEDANGTLVRSALATDKIDANWVLSAMPQTAESVILYDRAGRRAAFTDLKDIQERVYPLDRFQGAAADCDVLVICNINFARGMLAAAKRMGKLVVTDLHAIADLDDAFNADFMRAGDILFMSHERLPVSPEQWAQAMLERYPTKLLVIGLGADGALLAVRQDNFIGRFPARQTRQVVNTIGAGDALFAGFLHAYLQSGDPYRALEIATVFASWKIGVSGGADGFLNDIELDNLAKQLVRGM